MSIYQKFGKRLIDLLIAVVGIVVFAIPMLVIAIAVKLDSPGSALFLQRRLGKHHKIFTIYKFRSMCMNAYEMGGVATSSADARITRVGAFLRRTSLDELPQLFNILVGQMSIIGPRPILPEEYDEFPGKEQYAARFDVTPGLFCTVDVDYRAAAERKLQFEMDTAYAKNITLRGDLKVFFGVIKTVISGENVYKEEEHDK